MKLYSVTVTLRLAAGHEFPVEVSSTVSSDLLTTRATATAKQMIRGWDANPTFVSISWVRVTVPMFTEPVGC